MSQADSQAREQPLRILMVAGVYPTGHKPHAGTFIKAQADSLVEAGLKVEVIHPRPGPVPLRYASATLQVFFKTLTGRFDVVHGHYGLWCLASRLQWRAAVVADYLGDDLLGTIRSDGTYSKKSLLVVHVSQWLCRHVAAVLVKSEQMKRAAGAGNIYVMPDGTNFDLFRPMPRAQVRAALGWDAHRSYVVFANNPTIPVKNFALAQAAVELLKAKGMEVELVVANGLPQEKVVEYMNASNALVLPSLAEGSPNVVREAMACNVPVVATDVGDVAQVIGRTKGCRICPHDAAALAAGLEEALGHSGPTTGREDTAELSSAAIARRLIEMYEHITNKKARNGKAHVTLKGEGSHGQSA